MKFKVSVEKTMYTTGAVEVEANTEEEAIKKIEGQIDIGELQTTSVEWDDLQYEDCSFKTTGDVE